MQNKTMDMRRTALKLLIAKHRAEYQRMVAENKEVLRLKEPHLTVDGLRNRARSQADSDLAQLYFLEFRAIHDQVKALEGKLWGIDLFTNRIRDLWASGRTREQIITQSRLWPESYARQMLRRKYRAEYQAIIKLTRPMFSQNTVYVHATTELIRRYRREYNRFRQQCRVVIVNLLNELERKPCQVSTQDSELSLGSGTK